MSQLATPTVSGQFVASDEPLMGNRGTGYYTIINNSESEYQCERGYRAGELVYVYAGSDGLHAFIGESEYLFRYDNPGEAEEFVKDFKFEPNGAQRRQEQIAVLMAEIANEDLLLTDTKAALGEFNPHVGSGGTIEGSTSLAPSTGGMAAAKQSVALARNQALKTQKSLMAKTETLKLLASEQSRALKVKLKEIKELAAKAEEAIWTINLYLGKEEEIITIASGEPAPDTQKITIRQSVLFMDEECGVDAEDFGIDVNAAYKFDEWLMADPAHLVQVLPETKGIVALHPRRVGKKYEDPWVNNEMNQANLHWTYFLVRNGQNVYRVYVDLDVGRTLFPSASEFEDYFWGYEDGERVPLKPGSKKWVEAMEASENRQKHYMRVLLVLQGLMDRTPIFRPMPTNRINLCDPRHCEEWLHLIYETENVLTDGKPDFDKWQAEVNAQLEVGCRVIGAFCGYDLRPKNDYEEGRIWPANASPPGSEVLHTLDERDGDRYFFRYERTKDRVYGNYYGRGHQPKTRARCWVEKDDKFVLNFDAVELDRLLYYKNHKQSRQYYARMLPVLEAAIAYKEKEREQEAPFKLLVVGQLIARYGIDMTEAETQAAELVRWWKFKNRTHRALTDDDQKALKMIVDECGNRQKQQKIRTKATTAHQTVLAAVLAAYPNPLLVAHKKDNQYVVFLPHNYQNIWVTEQLWTFNSNNQSVRCKESREWKLVDKRFERWETLHKDDRWDAWQVNKSASEVLTDPEILTMVEEGVARYGSRCTNYKERFLPLAAIVDPDFQIRLWFSDSAGIIPTEHLIHNRATAPTICRTTINWKRVGGVAKVGYTSDTSRYSYLIDQAPWSIKMHDQNDQSTVKLWEDNIKQVSDEFQLYKETKRKSDEMAERYNHVGHIVADLIYDRAIAKAKLDFFYDHGDPELWEDHLKTLNIRKSHLTGLYDALNLLVERNINPTGMTIKEVYDRAAEFGLYEIRDNYRYTAKAIPEDAPIDFVIPEPQSPGDDD